MLRTIVLLLTHGSMLVAGAGVATVTLRSRRQELLGKAVILDTRETVLQATADRLRHPGQPLATAPLAGRHRAARTFVSGPAAHPVPSRRRSALLNASLEEAIALNITAIAEHEQRKRVFVDIMTNIAQARQWRQASASVLAATSVPAVDLGQVIQFEPRLFRSRSMASVA